MALVHAAFPAPFWTRLTYNCDKPLCEGLRLLVPLARRKNACVAVSVDEDVKEDVPPEKIKNALAVIDDSAVLPDELWRLIKWFGKTWLIGAGFAMKTLLPAKFFTEEKLPAQSAEIAEGSFGLECEYCANVSARYDFYAETLRRERASLMLFPEQKLAKSFWNALPKDVKDEGALCPASSGAKWELWKESLRGNVRFVVGPPGAAFLPLKAMSAIIMDEENHGAWRSQAHPVFHARSLLGMRAKFASSRFVLGGSVPSSKSFLNFKPECIEEKNDKKIIFVSLKEALASEFDAISDAAPISAALLRETSAARRDGRFVFWILDRKGYAGEISCLECGGRISCKRCGSVMRWEERQKKMSCVSCGFCSEIPSVCPNCGGKLLTGSRPGLEALHERALGALKAKYKNVLLFQNHEEEKEPSAPSLIKEYPKGALVLGTRRLISFCDELSPSVIGWIDADMEARGAEYDARARAFFNLWESMWRGDVTGGRKIVVQSRVPGRGWQEGLRRGWRVFWQKELAERKELELPPFVPMIKITASQDAAQKIASRLEEAGVADYWASGGKENEIWVRTKNFAAVERVLRPFFDIKSAEKGFPAVLLYSD